MKTDRFYLGFGLLCAAGSSSAGAAWVAWMVYRVAIPSGGSWQGHVGKFAAFLMFAIVCWLAGVCFLVLERRKVAAMIAGRKKFDHFTLTNIALAAYPKGSDFVDLLETRPALATRIADLAHQGKTRRQIVRDPFIINFLDEVEPDSKAEDTFCGAVVEIVEIYAGVSWKPFVPARRRGPADLNP